MTGDSRAATLEFGDNAVLAALVGDHDRHLLRLEQGLGVRLTCRGNRVAINGEPERVRLTRETLAALYRKAERGVTIDSGEIDSAIRLATSNWAEALMERGMTLTSSIAPPSVGEEPRLPLADLPAIRTKRGPIAARSAGQAAYMEMLSRSELVFGIGPAGTGKTYLAVAQAVAMLQSGQVDRIVLSRPAVEAGERLGFLPGDMKDKIDPYLRPLYDALHDMMPGDQVMRRMTTGEIEVAPLAFMRGRTLAHAFVILDEAQNTTTAQMKMFLTRMGHGTRMVVTGDLSQIDLPSGVTSGLRDAIETLEGLPGIGITRFQSVDVVRHPLVARIVDAYDQRAVAVRDMSRSRSRRENDGTSK
ncbi:PhoH family protein [Ameyamaea chiangmaiensis]|uniref:PhoH-like protein n=1 Tax=Ameyamaea chiangmaiensis TaxID=442969 RepID=A0A850PIU8_9PROT|nr:PhoH family protein [Ameyamaea chiangmaiensis]MBS4075352.1 PhoH family protein [Ameyamaea chiangmaiensis]NVN41191.1 PhoH family protein [Ameyamaea chiangmaiensis]